MQKRDELIASLETTRASLADSTAALDAAKMNAEEREKELETRVAALTEVCLKQNFDFPNSSYAQTTFKRVRWFVEHSLFVL